MTKTMQAALITHYKQAVPEIQNVPLPTVRPNDVLVRIVAASINPIDLKTKDGKLRLLLKYQMPLILGSDFSGIVTKVGTNVTRFKVGDAVFGRPQKDRIGTFADFLAIDQHDIALKPSRLTFEEAAALPLVSLTSYQALHDLMHLTPDQKVLIQAGAGGVGTVAIQIAKALGAEVATTTSSQNIAFVKSLGADHVIDYHRVPFQNVLSDYDGVFDTLGGTSLANAFQIVKPGGMIVSVSGIPDEKFSDAYNVPIWKKVAFRLANHHISKLARKTGVTYRFLFMHPSGSELEKIGELVENDKLRPIVDRVLPFAQLPEAFAYSQAGHAKGKIILKLVDNPNSLLQV